MDRRVRQADRGQPGQLHCQVVPARCRNGLQSNREAVEQAGRDRNRRMTGEVEGPA
jgi:hypothetical protein